MADGLEGMHQVLRDAGRVARSRPENYIPHWQHSEMQADRDAASRIDHAIVLALLSHLWGREVTAEQAAALKPGCVGDALRHLREAYVFASSYVDPVENIEAALRALGEEDDG